MRLDTIFSGISAGSALAVAVVAVWAAFLTDLPEVLVRQLRSDIASAQEELTELRRQKLAEEGRVSELTGDLDQADSELETRRGEVAALTMEKNRLRDQVREIREQRRKYFENTKDQVVKPFFDGIRYDVSRLLLDTELLRTFSDYERWIESEPAVVGIGPFATSASIKRYRKWERDTPKPWLSEASSRRLVEFGLGDNFVIKHRARLEGKPYRTAEDVLGRKPRWRTYSEVADDFRKEIADKSRAEPTTGRTIIETKLRYESLDLFLPEDRERFDSMVNEFLDGNLEATSARLSIRLPQGWQEPDLLREARLVEERVAEFERVFEHLRARVEEDF